MFAGDDFKISAKASSTLGKPADSVRSDTALKASSPYPSAGSSNAPSPGSAAAADWPRIGNASTARRSPSCASPPFASCCENYAIPRDVLGQTLSLAACSTTGERLSGVGVGAVSGGAVGGPAGAVVGGVVGGVTGPAVARSMGVPHRHYHHHYHHYYHYHHY